MELAIVGYSILKRELSEDIIKRIQIVDSALVFVAERKLKTKDFFTPFGIEKLQSFIIFLHVIC